MRDHTVANFDAVDVGSNGFDDTGPFTAGGRGERNLIESLSLIHLDEVHARCGNTNENLAACGVRIGNRLEGEGLGATERNERGWLSCGHHHGLDVGREVHRAMTSISTDAPSGKAVTATVVRAGYGFSNRDAYTPFIS